MKQIIHGLAVAARADRILSCKSGLSFGQRNGGLYSSVSHSITLRARRRRSDSCFNCKGPGGEDVSGGYYEAGGSFLKLGIVESFLVTLLGYALDTFPKGFAKGDLQNALDGLEWGASCALDPPSLTSRAAQA